MDIILHCLDPGHLKAKPLIEVFPAVCRFNQVSGSFFFFRRNVILLRVRVDVPCSNGTKNSGLLLGEPLYGNKEDSSGQSNWAIGALRIASHCQVSDCSGSSGPSHCSGLLARGQVLSQLLLHRKQALLLAST